MANQMNDGTVQLFNTVNTAEPGAMPVYQLDAAGDPQDFAEVTVGMNRQYLARGVDERIDMMIQIWPEQIRPKIGQIAVLTYYEYQEDPDGDQYRIDNVQRIENEDGLQVFQLTLYRLEDNYDYIS